MDRTKQSKAPQLTGLTEMCCGLVSVGAFKSCQDNDRNKGAHL